jgi:hypothetical protein
MGCTQAESVADSKQGRNEMTNLRVERLVARDVPRALNLRLRRLTGSTICAHVLSRRTSSLGQADIKKKGEEMASSVRSALGFWESNAASLNSKILNQYYAALHFSIAEQVTTSGPESSLQDIQRHTERGHGLSTITGGEGEFPSNYYVAALSSGHFPCLLQIMRRAVGTARLPN